MDQDRVRAAFTKTDFMGIRSLPNALEPNFRETLYQEVLGLTAADMDKQRSAHPRTFASHQAAPLCFVSGRAQRGLPCSRALPVPCIWAHANG